MSTLLKPGIRALLGLIAATRVQYSRSSGKKVEALEVVEGFAKLERAAIALVDQVEAARACMSEAAELLDRVRFALPSSDDRTIEVIEGRDELDDVRGKIDRSLLVLDQSFVEISKALAPAKNEGGGVLGGAIANAGGDVAVLLAPVDPTRASAAGGALDAHLAGLENAWTNATTPARGGPRAGVKARPADAGPLFADPNAPPI